MNDQCEAWSRSSHGPLQHLQITVRVAERSDRATSDVLLDADRLARLVIDEIDLRQLHKHRLAVPHFEREPALAANYLFWRNAVDLLCPRPHELNAAARHDVRLEPVVAQIGEQFEHGLINEIGIGPFEARMARHSE